MSSFLAWTAGGPARDWTPLLSAVEDEGRVVLGAFRHQGCDDGHREDIQQTVLLRLYGSARRALERLRDQAGAPGSQRSRIRAAAARGATPSAIEGALGRALSSAEWSAAEKAVESDGAARAYLRVAIRNGFIDLLRRRESQRRREAALPEPSLDAAPAAPSPALLRLFEEVMMGFESWGNARGPSALQAGTRNARRLAELEQAGRRGWGAREVVLAEQPTLAGDSLRRALDTRRRAWSRSRERFFTYLSECELSQEQRLQLRALADERFRLRRRAASQNTSQAGGSAS